MGRDVESMVRDLMDVGVALVREEEKERVKTKSEILNSILIKIHPNGGLKYVVIPEDTSVQFLAAKFKISEDKLMKWNELDTNMLKKNEIVFLEQKNTHGNTATYKAESSESYRI